MGFVQQPPVVREERQGRAAQKTLSRCLRTYSLSAAVDLRRMCSSRQKLKRRMRRKAIYSQLKRCDLFVLLRSLAGFSW